MLYRSLIIAAVLATSGCAANGQWTPEDTTREVVWQGLNAVDAWQTTGIRERDDLQESALITRAVIGSQPETADTVLYFATSALIHYAISRALPEELRPWWQGGTIAYSGALVLNNCRHQLGPCQ